jgi:hypothetical protein
LLRLPRIAQGTTEIRLYFSWIVPIRLQKQRGLFIDHLSINTFTGIKEMGKVERLTKLKRKNREKVLTYWEKESFCLRDSV